MDAATRGGGHPGGQPDPAGPNVSRVTTRRSGCCARSRGRCAADVGEGVEPPQHGHQRGHRRGHPERRQQAAARRAARRAATSRCRCARAGAPGDQPQRAALPRPAVRPGADGVDRDSRSARRIGTTAASTGMSRPRAAAWPKPSRLERCPPHGQWQQVGQDAVIVAPVRGRIRPGDHAQHGDLQPHEHRAQRQHAAGAPGPSPRRSPALASIIRETRSNAANAAPNRIRNAETFHVVWLSRASSRTNAWCTGSLAPGW